MINRAKMPRQLRGKGGITNVTPRTNFLLGGIKSRIRKLIPNELASVAVKAAPFVAPFNPAIAGLMRGIGRFDQRGSLSDAVKQGLGTYAAGQLFRTVGGGDTQLGFRGADDKIFTSPLSQERTQAIGNLFDKKQVNTSKVTKDPTDLLPQISPKKELKKFIEKLPRGVAAQLAAGTVTAGASLLASYFQGEFREQEPGETMEDYLAARRDVVGKQMRTYMDSYYKFDPTYSALDDAGKNAFVARYNVKDGGRIGYQTGGISMANTLAQNRAINEAQRQAVNESILNPSRQKVLERLQRNQPTGPSLFERWSQHAPVSQAMKGETGMGVIPEYGLQTGADFQTKFSNVNPKVSSGLAAAYQVGQEGLRALNPTSPDFLNLKKAYQTAQDQATQNIEGILAADTGTLTAEQQANRNKYLASQGQPTETMTGDYADTGIESRIADAGQTYADGATTIPGFRRVRTGPRGNYNEYSYIGPDGQTYGAETYASIAAGRYPDIYDPNKATMNQGGRVGQMGGGMPTGIMRTNKVGVKERDYRDKGGFVPVGIKEKADDVPAMLSKNEFVMTANAVRGAGGGSIEKGAQRMYDTMKKLEKRVV